MHVKNGQRTTLNHLHRSYDLPLKPLRLLSLTILPNSPPSYKLLLPARAYNNLFLWMTSSSRKERVSLIILTLLKSRFLRILQQPLTILRTRLRIPKG